MNAAPVFDSQHAEFVRQMARDVRMRLLVRVSLLHSAGGFGTFAYLQVIYPPSKTFDSPWINDVGVLILYLAVVAPLAWGLIARAFRNSGSWALTGRPPTATERELTLTEPFRMAAWPFVLWMVTTVVIATASASRRALEGGQILDLAQIMLMGGLATCSVSYLVIEQTYRPMFATALAGGGPDQPRALGIRHRLLLAWAASSGVPLLGVLLVPFRETATSPVAILTLGLIGIAAGLFSTAVAANSIAAPLDEVRAALERVAHGDIGTDLLVDDGGEIGQVQVGFNDMVHGLRERQHLQDLFGRHVGHEVAAQALERGTDLGGEQRRASVIFVDIVGSTAMAEVLPPGEVVATLNAFFRTVVQTVTEEGGWVNKFEGDGALCIFGVPGFQPDHEARALRAARKLHERLAALNAAHPGLDAGLGVSSGTVVAGNVGSEERFEYTVIGRTVNEAARLTDLAKQRPGRVLASGSTVRAAGEEGAHWRDHGRVGLRGQQAPTSVFELAAPTRTMLSR